MESAGTDNRVAVSQTTRATPLLHVKVDNHIYSLFKRPPATSPLVRQARQDTLLRDAPDPCALVDDLSTRAQLVLQASLHVDAVGDAPLHQMFMRMSLRRTRAHTHAIEVLEMTRYASRAITAAQGPIFDAIVHGETKEALIRLTRTDDLALNVITVCATVMQTHNDFDRSDTVHNVRMEATGCSTRLTKARNLSRLRIRALDKENEQAKKKYHDVLDELKQHAAHTKYASKVEREASRNAFLASGAVGVANVLTCLCGKERFRRLFEGEKMQKETVTTAQATKWRIVDEKVDLRKMLRVHADAMSKADAALSDERRRHVKYSQAAAAAKKLAEALEVIDEMNQCDEHGQDDDCAMWVILCVKNAVNALRVQGSQIGISVLQMGVVTSDISAQEDEEVLQTIEKYETLDDELSQLAELLLRFYAGWAAISDFCEECVFYVNHGGAMVGAHIPDQRVSVRDNDEPEVKESTASLVASSSKSTEDDEMKECTEQLDALIRRIKTKHHDIDKDATL